jgi:hypothetical protein
MTLPASGSPMMVLAKLSNYTRHVLSLLFSPQQLIPSPIILRNTSIPFKSVKSSINALINVNAIHGEDCPLENSHETGAQNRRQQLDSLLENPVLRSGFSSKLEISSRFYGCNVVHVFRVT